MCRGIRDSIRLVWPVVRPVAWPAVVLAVAALAGCPERDQGVDVPAVDAPVAPVTLDAPALAPADAAAADPGCRGAGLPPPGTVMDRCKPQSVLAEPLVYLDDVWVDASPLERAGTAVCRFEAASRVDDVALLQLGACSTVAGDAMRSQVQLEIYSAAFDLPESLVSGASVRLSAIERIADEHGPSGYWYVLRSEPDGELLVAWSEGSSHLVPGEGALAALSLTPEAWLAPLSISLAGGLCAAEPGLCEDGNTVERGAVEITLPESGTARILDNATGYVGHAYRVHTGPVLIYARPEGCVDDQARASVLIVALRACAARGAR